MKSLKLNFKSAYIACFAFFLSSFCCFAQAPFYVPHRIESEILKYEISKLDTKDKNYQTKLASLQKQEAAFSAKAMNLENAILKAFIEEQNGAKSPIKVLYNGINIEMTDLASAAPPATRPPPGPTPCQGGKCYEFFVLSQQCDWAKAVAVKKITIDGIPLMLYFIQDMNSKMTTDRHKIDANSSFPLSRI